MCLWQVISLSLAVVYQSHDLSLVNLVGLVVCLLGISFHVVRKATAAPELPTKQSSRYTRWETSQLVPRQKVHIVAGLRIRIRIRSDPDLFGRIRKIFTGSGSYRYFGNVKLCIQEKKYFKI